MSGIRTSPLPSPLNSELARRYGTVHLIVLVFCVALEGEEEVGGPALFLFPCTSTVQCSAIPLPNIVTIVQFQFSTVPTYETTPDVTYEGSPWLAVRSVTSVAVSAHHPPPLRSETLEKAGFSGPWLH
ncbi:hypothetical protein BP00DRAFT_39352 [Aspergillus indologenus CBS 114.80]|uniref:Uncharacterized protein n=1 Tax=Aspergillus indologenus CBS 114.80 TaxID=1450541 RepID=A0A2V5IHA8_9EURO|nr:hypothetical protein BP00DRAFT_39352 [Aspergillus indologenus CBS 114.80]